MVATRRSARTNTAATTATATAASPTTKPAVATAPVVAAPAKKQTKKRAAPSTATKKARAAPNKKTKTSKTTSISTSKANTKAKANSKPKPAQTCTTIPTPAASAPPAAQKKTSSNVNVSPPVDTDIPCSSSYTVVKDDRHDEWYDVVLNQCNITGTNNNNKYYRIQLLQANTSTGTRGYYHVWFKWGRVGEARNQNDLKGGFASLDDAIKVFEKKYKDKSGNKWGPFADFQPKNKKYTRIQIDNEVEVSDDFKANINVAAADTKAEDIDIEYLPSKLDPKTKELMEVLFSEDMRNEALSAFDLDLKRLPLGVPSQQQIQAGVSILNDIEEKLNGNSVSGSYQELSSRFYTAIPHSFGRRRPPVINTQTSLQERYDMCNILLDMYSQNEAMRMVEKEKQPKKQVPYPADSHYDTLKADMNILDKKSKEWKTIQKYFNETSDCGSIIDAWEVDREGEKERFERFDDLDNRRLLWHGTNIAVVAPIITSGLRIMPHSGGRVGKGIYLASMQAKSAGYTSGYGSKFACMFLCEGAMGKSHEITQDDWRIQKPPSGYDSVLAAGNLSPNVWNTIKIDGKDVSVPQSKGVSQTKNSSFYHDEFLVYDEAQVRLRYVLTVKLH